MIANYHTHTTRCHHATGNEEDYVLRAIENGLEIFGFSDHVPMPFPDGHQSGFRVRLEALEDYVRTVEALRDQYADRIRILLGFEAEYYPDLFGSMLHMIAPYPVDYLLLAQHFNDSRETIYNPSMAQDRAALTRYVDMVVEGMETGAFTYVAHPDLFYFAGLDEVYAEVFGTEAAIVRHSIANGTHALTIGLFGLLRPGDTLLSVTGELYDTLKGDRKSVV